MEKQREIVRRWMAGEPFQEIKVAVGVSNAFLSNVVTTARAIGLEGPRFPKGRAPNMTPQQDLEALKRKAEGESYSQLARRFGVSTTAISRALKRAKGA